MADLGCLADSDISRAPTRGDGEGHGPNAPENQVTLALLPGVY
jgi:hypothetical protein